MTMEIQKIKNIKLGTMTMNAGDDFIDSPFKLLLKDASEDFETIIVFDGNLTEHAKEFYANYKNVLIIDYPWNDSYVQRYERFAKEFLQNEEWGLWLDDDESVSEDLKNYLLNWPNVIVREDTKIHQQTYSNANNHVIVRIPCVLALKDVETNNYYAAEPPPPYKRFDNTWVKQILFKKHKDLKFWHEGSHVVPQNSSTIFPLYTEHPYHHLKTLESFVYNDVWQAFLSPEGQGYSPQESALFKALTKQYKSTKEFKKATFEGKWSFPLQRFAYEHRNDYDRPISRLAWVYWTLEQHPYPFPTKDRPLWDFVKQFVLSKESLDIFAENKQKGNKLVLNNG